MRKMIEMLIRYCRRDNKWGKNMEIVIAIDRWIDREIKDGRLGREEEGGIVHAMNWIFLCYLSLLFAR